MYGVAVENLWRYQLRWNLARKARLPEGLYEIRAYLVLHGGNRGSGGKRSCVGKPVEQEFQTEEMVTVSMGDVNGCEIPAALGDPIYEFLRMLHGQKRVYKDGIAFAVNERDRIGDPSQIFLAGWKALGRTPPFFGQKLLIQLGHKFSLLSE